MTRKEFKERSSIHVYGKGPRRRVALYYDWKEGDDFRGFKYMIKGYGVTQADILRDAYDMLILDNWDSLCWYDAKVAETDEKRFRVSLTG